MRESARQNLFDCIKISYNPNASRPTTACSHRLSKLWEYVLKGTLRVGDYVPVDAENKYRVKIIA